MVLYFNNWGGVNLEIGEEKMKAENWLIIGGILGLAIYAIATYARPPAAEIATVTITKA